jgi:hypothetical protein
MKTMKTRNHPDNRPSRSGLSKLSLLAALALGSVLLSTGCMLSSETEAQVEIAGVLQGDAQGSALAKSATEVEGAIVTAHEVSVNGVVGPAVAQSQTNAQGAFTLKTNLKGARKLIVRAVHSGTEWSAHFEGTLTSTAPAHTRPLNLESSVAAAVWLELQKTPEGRTVHSSEVTVAVDADVALAARGAFRGSDTARARILTHLATVVEEGSKAREAVTVAVYARAQAAQERASAEAAFEASLRAAGTDTAAIRAARKTFVRAVLDADAHAGLDVVIQARSREAAYHALVFACERENLSDSARAALTRNAAKILASASDAALQAQFTAAGAAEARIEDVAEAGAAYEAAISVAATQAACDTAIGRYRAAMRAHFDSAFVSVSVAVNAVASTIDSISVALDADVTAEAGSQGVGEAYAEAHAEARARVIVALAAVSDQAKAAATADVVAFLQVHAGS